MQPPDDSSSNSFRYFVVGVLCVAVLLGVYFVRLNAQVDSEREAANERLALCRQMESVARTVLPDNAVTWDMCGHLTGQGSKSVALP